MLRWCQADVDFVFCEPQRFSHQWRVCLATPEQGAACLSVPGVCGARLTLQYVYACMYVCSYVVSIFLKCQQFGTSEQPPSGYPSETQEPKFGFPKISILRPSVVVLYRKPKWVYFVGFPVGFVPTSTAQCDGVRIFGRRWFPPVRFLNVCPVKYLNFCWKMSVGHDLSLRSKFQKLA